MFILYDLAFLIIAIFYLPVYLIKGKFHRGFFARLGFLPKAAASLEGPIWIHAVSVGEAKAVAGLVRRLSKSYPEKKIIFSTVTPTGNQVAAGLLSPQQGAVTYLPLDFSFIVRPVLKKIKPSLFIIVETEIWPNLISALSKMRIPIVVVNARLSDRSFRGYRLLRLFFRPLLRAVNKFCAQSKEDVRRLVVLGVEPSRICLTGNLKFDFELSAKADGQEERKKLLLSSSAKLLVCGSTHPKEELLLLDVYCRLQKQMPDLVILLAPRHPERAKAIKDEALCRGLCPVLISQIGSPEARCLSRPVFILDIMGELNRFYAAADLVFIGGSLVKKGGHNLLEPVAAGKPVLFGPHMFNFREIADMFIKRQAALAVKGIDELEKGIKFLLENEKEREAMVQRASAILKENQGATELTLQQIGLLM